MHDPLNAIIPHLAIDHASASYPAVDISCRCPTFLDTSLEKAFPTTQPSPRLSKITLILLLYATYLFNPNVKILKQITTKAAEVNSRGANEWEKGVLR
jgi:hypothetical protein